MNLEELIAAVLDVESSLVTADTIREDIEHWDSLAQLSLISALEETYEVVFTSAEMQSLVSVPVIRAALRARSVDC